MKYRIEFSVDDFRKGYCHKCPLADYTEDYYFCTLGYDYEDCPLEEVKEGYWYSYDPERCSVCKLPWNDNMTMNGEDIGYFDPMPNFCPNCGAKMRSDKDD